MPDDEILTKADLAAKLKVTVRCIENWQGAGHLRYLKIAGVVRFHWPEVLAHLKKKYQVCHGSVAPGELADAQVVKAETLPGDVTGRLHGPRKAEIQKSEVGDQRADGPRKAEMGGGR